ncbi:MAG: glucokinase [Thioalkalispiraceae bacterium]
MGGTNTRLVLAEFDGESLNVYAQKNYYSNDYSGLQEVITGFFSEFYFSGTVDAACFAVAGPVKSGTASITNLPWVVSAEQLKTDLDIPHIILLNDFVAVAYGIAELDDDNTRILQHGNSEEDFPVPVDAAIIGAGTGLGVAHRKWIEDHYQVFSSEAGHVGFAPENQQQLELLGWLLKQHQHVSQEMVLSGKGLARIYRFLHEVHNFKQSSVIEQAMQETDPARAITEFARSHDDELCQRALDCFTDIYGAAAGNVALHYYPLAEIYIAGGIAPKILDTRLSQRFIKAFVNKGQMSSNLEQVRVKLIESEHTGLYGALARLKDLNKTF